MLPEKKLFKFSIDLIFSRLCSRRVVADRLAFYQGWIA